MAKSQKKDAKKSKVEPLPKKAPKGASVAASKPAAKSTKAAPAKVSVKPKATAAKPAPSKKSAPVAKPSKVAVSVKPAPKAKAVAAKKPQAAVVSKPAAKAAKAETPAKAKPEAKAKATAKAEAAPAAELFKCEFFFEVPVGSATVRKTKTAIVQASPSSKKAAKDEETHDELLARIERDLQKARVVVRKGPRSMVCTKCCINPVDDAFIVDRDTAYCTECALMLGLGHTREARHQNFHPSLMKDEEAGAEA